MCTVHRQCPHKQLFNLHSHCKRSSSVAFTNFAMLYTNTLPSKWFATKMLVGQFGRDGCRSNLRHDSVGWLNWFFGSSCIIRCWLNMIVCACISWLAIVVKFFIGSKIFQRHFETSRRIWFGNAFLFVNIAWRVRVFLEKWHSASIMRNQRYNFD